MTKSHEMGDDRPMADGHLEPHEHGKQERVEQRCSGHALRTPPVTRWGRKFTGTSGNERQHRTACPIDLLNPITAEVEVAEPKQPGAGTGAFHISDPVSVQYQEPFCVLGEKLWSWRNDSELHM